MSPISAMMVKAERYEMPGIVMRSRTSSRCLLLSIMRFSASLTCRSRSACVSRYVARARAVVSGKLWASSQSSPFFVNSVYGLRMPCFHRSACILFLTCTRSRTSDMRNLTSSFQSRTCFGAVRIRDLDFGSQRLDEVGIAVPLRYRLHGERGTSIRRQELLDRLLCRRYRLCCNHSTLRVFHRECTRLLVQIHADVVWMIHIFLFSMNC